MKVLCYYLILLDTGEMMATIPLNSTNIYPSTSNTNFPHTNPSEETLTLLVAGISTPLLVVALAVMIITVIAIVWIKGRKSTKSLHNHDTEQQDGSYATLTRQEYPDITSNYPMDVLYAVVDMNSQGERGQMVQAEQNAENPPNSEEKKGRIALEDLYAVVNKQQKIKQLNQDAPPTQSNTVDGVYYNTAAIRKGHAVEDEEIAPQIPPNMVEKLYAAVAKKPKGSTNPTEKTPP